MQFITFLGFTIIVAFISYLKTRKTNESSSDGYFLGGRSLTAIVIAGSLLLTNLSTEQIVGLNAAAFKEGVLVMAWETLAAIAMVITANFLLPKYLKGGITTVPQFLEKRYDKITKTITSGLFLSGYVVVLLPIVLYSGALAINTMFNVAGLLGVDSTKALWVTVWSIAIILGVVLYSISQFILKPYVIGIDKYPHFLHIMAILFLLNVLVMLLIGKYKARREDFELKYTNQVEISPWQYSNSIGIAICIIVIGLYIYFI